MDLGSQRAVVEKSGSWFSYKGERIGQGRENARQTLIERPELYQTIERELRTSLGLTKGGESNSEKQPPAGAGRQKVLANVG